MIEPINDTDVKEIREEVDFIHDTFTDLLISCMRTPRMLPYEKPKIGDWCIEVSRWQVDHDHCIGRLSKVYGEGDYEIVTIGGKVVRWRNAVMAKIPDKYLRNRGDAAAAVNFNQEVMSMNIAMLYEMQKELDARIIREKGLEGQDLLPNTVLALQVELGELANEWRGFKHWSNDREPRTTAAKCNMCFGAKAIHKPDPDSWIDNKETCPTCYGKGTVGPENPLLEEYVDCLHFFLSIARQLGIPAEKLENTDSLVIERGIIAAFSGLMSSVGMIRVYELAYYHAWNEFIALGKRLGFTWDEVSAAYVAKNRVNHERQEKGY